MNRFFIENAAIKDGEAQITGEDVKHITRVLRMHVDDRLMLCDGAGNEYLCSILSILETAVHVKILDMFRNAAEPPYTITLLQCLPKAGKMETIVQKCVELGVTRIVPVQSARSVVRLQEKEAEKKCLRYNRVAQEAAKQSRRGIVPEVSSVQWNLSSIDWSGYELVLVADEEERGTRLKDLLRGLGRKPRSIALLIGPEGGLERSEVACVKAAGGFGITLGNRILRTETAGMALLAMLQYELED